jgi:asparagine synthetase B (glutamine-hydrolysing)
MFSLVIYDLVHDSWIAGRDAFWIKPMFAYFSHHSSVIAFETSVYALLISTSFFIWDE